MNLYSSYEEYPNGYEDKDPLALTAEDLENSSMFLPNGFLQRAFNEFTAFGNFDSSATQLIKSTKVIYTKEGTSEDLRILSSASDMDTSDVSGGLTADNFTFNTQPIGVDDDKEIIREAKQSEKKETPTKRLKTRSLPARDHTPKVAIRPRKSVASKMKPQKKKNITIEENDEPEVKQNGLKRSASPDSSIPEKRRKIDTFERELPYMMRIDVGYHFILQVFEYLKVSELLRVSRVSKMWNDVAQHSRLWRTVKMKNSRVYDWEGFGNTLKKHRTENLDLRKMLLPADNQADIEDMWEKFGKAISDMPHLIRIDLGKCTASAIAKTAKACPQLIALVTMSLRAQFLDLKPLSLCKNLKELRLKSMVGMEVKNLAALKELPNLTTLGLTTIKNLDGIEECLSTNLTSLELGDCCDLRESFALDFLPCLVNLKRLRLEKGTQNCPIMSLMITISQLPNLRQLELINFDIQSGFDNALAKCTNLKVLLIIPTYIKQSATTNHVVMGGISQLRETLTYFIWGLTLELLRVTDIFIDQVESQKGQSKPGQKKQGTGDSIPILKPMQGEETADGPNSAQVDILGIPKLRKVLATLLPDTKIKILKVPFSSTWRQTVTDSPYQ